jgi:hypothetical protein
MRADLIAASTTELAAAWREEFVQAAETYLQAVLRLAPSLRSPLALQVDANWDHRTGRDFYRVLYQNGPGPRSLGMWTPYEMEAFVAFYRWQQQAGHPLTPFDRLVLAADVAGRPDRTTLAEITNLTGVLLNGGAIEQHESLLLTGRPVPLGPNDPAPR